MRFLVYGYQRINKVISFQEVQQSPPNNKRPHCLSGVFLFMCVFCALLHHCKSHFKGFFLFRILRFVLHVLDHAFKTIVVTIIPNPSAVTPIYTSSQVLPVNKDIARIVQSLPRLPTGLVLYLRNGTLFTYFSKYRHVSCPTIPSCSNTLDFWNRFTAASVSSPKMPSTVNLP